MWNQPSSIYGWNLERNNDCEKPDPCAGCINHTDEFPYCKLPALESTTCFNGKEMRYYKKG